MPYFQNKNTNKINSNKKKKDIKDINKKNLKKQFKTKQAISHKVLQVKLKLKKEKNNNLYNRYNKSLKKTQMRHNKSAQDLKNKIL